ncbi:hypothetical protein K443DRAFT_8124 [Laccaria amethystina LaAM-08-1]|uniref:Uncharacterized protein n=1 Tax=Laccaria amethystina LaAM-08-1 TaxID=1095629 RepID=A0A0C9WPB6_9AGAR|nr:hypothetical protein K443DRAFT_8124 [Laccaria amethystina LaAM-08-1]
MSIGSLCLIPTSTEFRTNKPSNVISTPRLLAVKDANFDRVEKERRNIEILKIRFGEAALQVCEVMLKYMTDSKRIGGHVESQKASNIHPRITSGLRWTGHAKTVPGKSSKSREERRDDNGAVCALHGDNGIVELEWTRNPPKIREFEKNGSMMSGIQHLVSRDLTGSPAVSDHCCLCIGDFEPFETAVIVVIARTASIPRPPSPSFQPTALVSRSQQQHHHLIFPYLQIFL